MTCSINRFDIGVVDSLGAALTRAPDAGALAVWSSSGSSVHSAAAGLGRNFLRLAAEAQLAHWRPHRGGAPLRRKPRRDRAALPSALGSGGAPAVAAARGEKPQREASRSNPTPLPPVAVIFAATSNHFFEISRSLEWKWRLVLLLLKIGSQTAKGCHEIDQDA
ncbi:MAG: hypothetical protein JOZ54_01870 [Acidobacteria bacterium]|nr:hypothetical protein [Acidobacteriota bacterium]